MIKYSSNWSYFVLPKKTCVQNLKTTSLHGVSDRWDITRFRIMMDRYNFLFYQCDQYNNLLLWKLLFRMNHSSWHLRCWDENITDNYVITLRRQIITSHGHQKKTMRNKIFPTSLCRDHSRCVLNHFKDDSEHGLSQWKTSLHCNVVSHWLSQ